MRVACVLFDHLPFKVEIARNPRLARYTTIIFKQSNSQCTVIDTSPDVKNVIPDMPLQEARARCKYAMLIEADMAAYENAFNCIFLELVNWSPVVETTDLRCAYLGLSATEFISVDELETIDQLFRVFPEHLKPRIGIGNGKFSSYLAAMHSKIGRTYTLPLHPAKFLASFSVNELPIPWEIKVRLHKFGLHSLGQIASLPLGPIQAQFGPMGGRMWHLAQGIDKTPILPKCPKVEVSEEIIFPVPTISLEPLLVAIESLIGQLFVRPELYGRYVRTALVEGHVLNKTTWQRHVVFKSPVNDKTRMLFALKTHLDTLTLPGPLEDIKLTLRNLTNEVGKQENLLQEVRQRGQLREVVEQLKISQGHNPIYQIRGMEPWSRIPERQSALVPYDP